VKRNYQSFAAEMSDLSPLELRIVETVTLSKQLRTRLNRLRPRRTAQQPSARIWSAGIVDTIYIIGDWLDPTSHLRSRVWWIVALVLYAAASNLLVAVGAWQPWQAGLGAIWMVTFFTVALLAGIALRVQQRINNAITPTN